MFWNLSNPCTPTMRRGRCLGGEAASDGRGGVLVVGSLNLDITVEVPRLPTKGETLMASAPAAALAVGGKGANQAVAAARMSPEGGRRVRLVTRFGNDTYAKMLEQVRGGSRWPVARSISAGMFMPRSQTGTRFGVGRPSWRVFAFRIGLSYQLALQPRGVGD